MINLLIERIKFTGLKLCVRGDIWQRHVRVFHHISRRVHHVVLGGAHGGSFSLKSVVDRHESFARALHFPCCQCWGLWDLYFLWRDDPYLLALLTWTSTLFSLKEHLLLRRSYHLKCCGYFGQLSRFLLKLPLSNLILQNISPLIHLVFKFRNFVFELINLLLEEWLLILSFDIDLKRFEDRWLAVNWSFDVTDLIWFLNLLSLHFNLVLNEFAFLLFKLVYCFQVFIVYSQRSVLHL